MTRTHNLLYPKQMHCLLCYTPSGKAGLEPTTQVLKTQILPIKLFSLKTKDGIEPSFLNLQFKILPLYYLVKKINLNIG